MAISSFRDLSVWQKSMNLVEDVYKFTAKLPKTEQYGLVNQINRCAVSIPSNIAEGQQRNNRAEYRQFLGIAKGSSAELETQLILVNRLFQIDVKELLQDLSEIQKMLGSLSNKLK